MKYIEHFFLIFIASVTSVGVHGEEQLATFAGGCFWCMEPPYDKLEGVLETTSGYAGGRSADPSYEEVSSGQTGHAEVVQVRYDVSKVSYEQLLEVFWRNIDPVDAGGQFCDRGSQYRSAIFYHNEEQERLAQASKSSLTKTNAFSGVALNKTEGEKEIKTEIAPLNAFYPAEEYHQNYYEKNELRYNFYRWRCGRDQRLEELWSENTD